MKEFIFKTALFCVIGAIISSTFIYNVQKFRFTTFRLLKKSLKDNSSVILFGSSVNDHKAKNDTDRRSIAEMLDSLLPEKSVVGISHGAYHSEIYLEFVRYIIKNSDYDPIVIIPINLRYFSPEWDLRPEYQFIKERYLINGFPYFHFANWKYKEILPDEFNNSPVYYGNKPMGKVLDYLHEKKADVNSVKVKGFIFHYMQPLKKNNQKLEALKEICKISEGHNIKILMYITPIDYASAKQYEIDGFHQQQYANVNTIKSVLAEYAIELIDLSMALNHSYFDYGRMPNEHLNMNGRLFVANALQSVISHIEILYGN